MTDLELRLVEEQRKCLKCGHVRRSGDLAPDYACPACGAVYAKLEALQKARVEAEDGHRAEAIRLERKLALEEKFDREEGAREAAEHPRFAAAHAAYALMAVPLLVTQVASVAISYSMRRRAADSWLDDHFDWQIRTFWYLTVLAMLACVALLVGAGSMSWVVLSGRPEHLEWTLASLRGFAAVCAFTVMVASYRIGKGWYRLSQRESP